MVLNKEQISNVVNIPLALIITSAIIIVLTTNVNDENSLKALIGGYIGLELSILFLIILNIHSSNWIDLFPFAMLLGIITLMLIYLYSYFDRIVTGEVSDYYASFSILLVVFLGIQFIMITSALFSKSNEINGKLFSDTTFSLFALFGVINYLIVLTIGVVLQFYSTQG